MRYFSQSLAIRLGVLCLAATAFLPGAHAETARLLGDGLTGTLRDHIQSALPDEPDAETRLEARRMARRARRAAATALNSRAYFAPEIAVEVEDGPPPRPALRIVPGPQFTLGDVRIAYETLPPEPVQAAVAAALTLQTGDVALPDRVIAQDALLLRALEAEGYAFAELASRESVGDRAGGTLDVTYRLRTGPRIAFGHVRYVDDVRTRASHLDKLVPFEAGTPYDPATLRTLNARLTETRLFSSANAALADRPSDGPAPEGYQRRDVLVRLSERPRHTLSMGASFATDRGAGATAELVRRNVARRGDTLTGEISVAQLERAVSLTWDRPHEFGFGRGLILDARVSQEETDAFDTNSAGLGATLEVVKSRRLSYSFGVEGVLLRETARVSTRSDEAEERDLQLLTVRAGFQIDESDDLLDPAKGYRLDAAVEPSASFGGATSQLVRLSGQARHYLPIGGEGRLIFASRLRLGTVLGATLGDLPSDKRFFAGGGGSVRGFAYQSIGPRTPDGTPLGGRSLVETSAELRWRVRDRIGVVAFLDAGAVSDNVDFSFDSLRSGAGVGARYITTAGPIRLDVGVPLDRTRFDDPFQIYISIGQAF